MNSNNTPIFKSKLLERIQHSLNSKIIGTTLPPQGMSSEVFFATTSDGAEYAIKHGASAMSDVPAYKLIEQSGVYLPLPKLIDYFEFEGAQVVVMQKISYPLLESVPSLEMGNYVVPMIDTLRQLHNIKSDKPGLLTEPNANESWSKMLRGMFDGQMVDWNEITQRPCLDADLIKHSIVKVVAKIKATHFTTDYRLLHTDFNQRNLFVDTSNQTIAGVIDWEDAMYGDPIYDFARVRMLIWHFDLGNGVVQNYYNAINYSPHELELENLYWLIRVIVYLAWYSEDLNDFNTGRIKLHQGFLREYVLNN